MFGVICAGRPVQTDLTTLSPTQLTLSVSTRPSFSHLVVFLLPGSTLPADGGAAVYAQFPPAPGAGAEPPEFKLLGALSSDKPSALFRLNHPGLRPAVGGGGDDEAMVDDAGLQSPPNMAQTVGVESSGETMTLGISIEPATSIKAQLASLAAGREAGGLVAPTFAGQSQGAVVQKPSIAQPDGDRKLLAQRIIKHAFNFLASFVTTTPDTGQEMVPLRAFKDWWDKFERRVDSDPSFLDKEESS